MLWNNICKTQKSIVTAASSNFFPQNVFVLLLQQMGGGKAFETVLTNHRTKTEIIESISQKECRLK